MLAECLAELYGARTPGERVACLRLAETANHIRDALVKQPRKR